MSHPEISRVFRSKEEAMIAYDRLSRWYDWLASGSERPLAELGLKKINVSSGEKVLEIGFGTAHSLLVLATAVGDAGEVHGIDISRGMVKVARGKIARANLSQRISLEQGDAVVLPFYSDAFHAIFISFALELFDTPEISTVLSECWRVLRPGGRICVVAIARDEQEILPQRIYEWFHQHLPAYADCRPIFVQSALDLAGFQMQEIVRKYMWGLPVDICVALKPMRGNND
jgi:ubiquinone/menaquinone biosynthesis C-methylase UbiE